MPQMSKILRQRAIGMLTAGMSTRAVASELNVNFSTISRLQRRFREFGSTSNQTHNRRPRVTTQAQDLHIQRLHLQDRLRPATRTAAATIGLHNQIISAQTVRNRLRGKLICMLVVLTRVSTWLQFVVVTDLRGQMLTVDCVWHFGEVFSSRMNPDFHCTGQMADSVYGIVWVSGLLMSTLWIEWPMVAVGLWYGQAYVMDNEHRCILMMPFWMHRDTVTRSWGPLLCHSSTTITSCCSMIMHGPMLQGSVHNSWKLKTSQFLHGQHTHRTYHPVITLDRRIRQCVPVPANIQQLHTVIEEEWTNIPQSTTWSTLCKGAVALHEANGGHTRYLLVVGGKNGGKNKCCIYNFVQCIYANNGLTILLSGLCFDMWTVILSFSSVYFTSFFNAI